MRGKARLLRAAPVALGLMGLMSASTVTPALAQDSLPRERTGPLAQPVPSPDYANPADVPALPGEPSPPPVLTVPPTSLATRYSAISVSTEGAGVAVPQAGWTPPGDDISGLALDAPGAGGFDAAWVERQFVANDLVGKSVAYSQVLALLQLINRAFLANGYANSGVLPAGGQATDGETLALRLVNGSVTGRGQDGLAVRFADERACGLNRRYIARRMPSAQAAPFNAFALERDFRLLAADPAIRTLDASLQPGSRPGEASLDLVVEPECGPDLYLLAANDRSPAVGGARIAIGASKRNLFLPGDIVAGEASFADGLSDGFLSFSGPVFAPRTRLLLRGAINDAAVVEPRLEALDIKSREWSIEGGFAHTVLETPLIPDGDRWSPARSLALGALVVHRKTTSELLGQPFSFSPGSIDGRAEYTALRLTGDFVERGTRHVLALSLTGTLGLDGTRPDDPGALRVKRNFTALLAQASYARRLGQSLDVTVKAAGQYTGETLYSGERFSLGGQNSVRGYRENLLLADRALFGSVELGYNFSLTGAARDDNVFDWGAFRLSTFVEGGLADNARAPEPLPKTIGSAGVSASWQPSAAIAARVTYAEAFRDVRRDADRGLQDRGFHFSIIVRPLRLFSDR